MGRKGREIIATDVKPIVKALQAERCAIGTYQPLLKMVLHKDIVTRELAEDLLADEVKDEARTESLLGL